MRNNGDFLAGLLAGTVAGAVAALLLTPKTGSEAREFIADRAVRLRARGADEEEDTSKNLSD